MRIGLPNRPGLFVSETGPIEPRLGLIGPALPYRGGIAQYTSALHRTLRTRCNLHTVSFKRQYPGWLYLGESDIEPGYEGYREPGVFYILDPLNPWSWRKTLKSLTNHLVSAVIMEWWTLFWAPCFSYLAESLERKGVKVVFLCHNVFEHEGAPWKTFMSRALLSRRTAFLAHSEKDAASLKSLGPGAEIAVHPHPVFLHFPAARGTLRRRAGLELLFFGFVRRYKGLDVLAEAMRLLVGEDVFLTVAGEWWISDLDLRKNVKRLGNAELVDRYIPEAEAAEYFNRADVVVLPYHSATGTGVIPLSYHYGKPVIASRVGGIPDVVQDGVSGRLVEPGDPRALADAVREFLHRNPTTREGIEATSGRMTFESLSDCILGFLGMTPELFKIQSV
jgi:glycosyltransferase involved in cell wall biosynthesis